jgi:hypothetical protein
LKGAFEHLAVALLIAATTAQALAGEAPVALRAEHFLVPPSTGPVTYVRVLNRGDVARAGTLRIELPEGWKANRLQAKVSLKPGETARVPFAIEQAHENDSNQYRLHMIFTADGAKVTREQTVFCTTAPYFKPDIDGRAGDWKHAVPVTFTTDGKKTTARTYWNRRHFYALVEVEEADCIGYRKRPGKRGFDAVQLALAPSDAVTPDARTAKAARYEFLLVAARYFWQGDDCFTLLKAGEALAKVRQARPLGGREVDGAEVKVRRRRGVTTYECAIPWAAMPKMKPRVGREIRFSFLVHDPDGTGLRDWGDAAGLWPWQRSWLAWTSWRGAQWGKEPPFDGKIEWGLSSSKY